MLGLIIMEHTVTKFGAIIPNRVTISYQNFGKEISQSELFILLVSIGGAYISENKEKVKKNLIEMFKDPGNKLADKLIENIKSGVADKGLELETYEEFYGQMAYARSIDNLLTYFKEILAEVIIKKPSILKSRETERLDFILDYDSIEELQTAIAEKKIESLFYGGIDKIESYFEERLGVNLFKTEELKSEFNQAIKNRNLIVHNRGIISKEYLKEFPKIRLKLGDIIKISYEDISRVNLILLNFVAYLDNELATKFNLDLFDNN